MRARLALSLSLAISGTAGCYLAHEREASCAPAAPMVSPCVRWEPSGAPVLVSEAPSLDEGMQLTSAVASGCGVVLAWYTLSGSPIPMTLAFETRQIDWTGAPMTPVLAHPALTVTSSGSGAMELAARSAEMGAVVNTAPSGCRFVPLDATGADRGAPVPLIVSGCLALAATDDGYSMLSTSDDGGTPGSLVRLDRSGAIVSQAMLEVAAGRALWSRTIFSDGSFLLYTFREDPVTVVYSGWLRHFDAGGAARAPEVDVGVNGVPVLIAPTALGAISAWETAEPGGLPLEVRAIDRDGAPTGAMRELPAMGAQYGLVLTATPDGGAMAMWLEYHTGEMPDWRLQIQALASDATPRDAPTLAISGIETGAMRALVDTSGERALVLYDDEGVKALPLACVH